MFVKMSQEEQFDETTILEHPDLFVQWDENWRGKRGDIVWTRIGTPPRGVPGVGSAYRSA